MDNTNPTYSEAARAELLREVDSFADSHGLRDASLMAKFAAYLREVNLGGSHA